MNGLKLEEMDLSDMLDVIHYFYEDDLNYASVEAAQMAEARRISIFRQLYGVEYAYASTDTKNKVSSNMDFDLDDPVPFDSGKVPVKPYVPPTEMDADAFNPFGDVLDDPIK